MTSVSKYEQAFSYAEHCLKQDLLPAFLFHNVNHTLNEVVAASQELANLERLDEIQRLLLITAAHFHDLGLSAIHETNLDAFKAGRAVHEEKSVEIARAVLPGFGFANAELDIISGLIMATKWGHAPQNLSEQIICDADMSSIGMETAYYLQSAEALRQELAAFGMVVDPQEWIEYQVELLTEHAYHTPSAIKLYDANRQTNIVALKALQENAQ